MLNESAARLEIISHGLVKEIQSLCSGLAAGASKVKKESSTSPSQLVIQLRRIASKIDASKNPDRTLVAKELKRTLAALAAGAGTFSPRPGDDVSVTPAGGENEFRVEGILDGVALAGIAVTHRDGGLEFRSDDGSELEESVYDTLCDVMGDADPSCN
jgi:hypothetical protein